MAIPTANRPILTIESDSATLLVRTFLAIHTKIASMGRRVTFQPGSIEFPLDPT